MLVSDPIQAQQFVCVRRGIESQPGGTGRPRPAWRVEMLPASVCCGGPRAGDAAGYRPIVESGSESARKGGGGASTRPAGGIGLRRVRAGVDPRRGRRGLLVGSTQTDIPGAGGLGGAIVLKIISNSAASRTKQSNKMFASSNNRMASPQVLLVDVGQPGIRIVRDLSCRTAPSLNETGGFPAWDRLFHIVRRRLQVERDRFLFHMEPDPMIPTRQSQGAQGSGFRERVHWNDHSGTGRPIQPQFRNREPRNTRNARKKR